ncbi:hypothetical protein [Streptomyces barringtoniae]|uniref:hypothetical protein n=1 Tax=Streptomyces barringtoniae TaxID=2892029 RepID=UPI001E4D9C47|nr:hypothetical protein [Streptomyces barringtoniae]MCC5474508.1 hypothetical protein [Streptomyces barringtoniae]
MGTAVDAETVLTIASIYWFTNTGASSARLYHEERHTEHPTEPTTAPTGLASFAYDFRPVRKFAERDHSNIVSWSEFGRGGHWATHDAPDLLVADLRQLCRGLRTTEELKRNRSRWGDCRPTGRTSAPRDPVAETAIRQSLVGQGKAQAASWLEEAPASPTVRRRGCAP